MPAPANSPDEAGAFWRAQGALTGYHLLPSVRADFLKKLERFEEAKVEFERAAAMTQNAREKALLLGRAAEMDGASAEPARKQA